MFPAMRDWAFLSDGVTDRAEEIFAQAIAAVQDDAVVSARVAYARLSLDKLLALRGDKAAVARYRETGLAEKSRRGLTKDCEDPVRIAGIIARFKVPVPPEFKDVPADRLFLFNANAGGTHLGDGIGHSVDHGVSPVGEAIRIKLAEYTSEERRLCDDPFPVEVSPVFEGRSRFTAEKLDQQTNEHYHWYKLASDVKLEKNSQVKMFAKFAFDLEGAFRDNTDLGSSYDVYMSLCRMNDLLLIDRFAVVRKKRE